MAQNNLLHQCQLLRKNQWRKGAAIGLFLMEHAWRVAELWPSASHPRECDSRITPSATIGSTRALVTTAVSSAVSPPLRLYRMWAGRIQILN
jgi:hypothetical protein